MKSHDIRPNRDAKIDARISSELRRKIERIAAVREQELAEIVRAALRDYAARFESNVAA